MMPKERIRFFFIKGDVMNALNIQKKQYTIKWAEKKRHLRMNFFI